MNLLPIGPTPPEAMGRVLDNNFINIDNKFNNINTNNINFNSGVWWEEIARITISSNTDNITLSSIPARKYLQVHFTGIATGGTLNTQIRFNSDTGNNYAYSLFNNGAYSATTSTNLMPLDSSAPVGVQYGVYNIINISNREKMVEGTMVSSTATGAATAPTAIILHGKWANTANLINTILYFNNGTGDFAAGSEIIVLGHN
jgi:hypothetical protein